MERLDPFIGSLFLRQVHMDSLQPFIASRRADGVKTATINLSLAVVRRIVNVAASEWRDGQGMTWLEHAAKIKLLPVKDARPAYPLSREEQAAHFQELPDHLARMSLFKVNTGTRDQEVCGLKWADEVQVPELNTSVFIIEGDKVKNEQDRLIVLKRRTFGGRQRQGSTPGVRLLPVSKTERGEARALGQHKHDGMEERSQASCG